MTSLNDGPDIEGAAAKEIVDEIKWAIAKSISQQENEMEAFYRIIDVLEDWGMDFGDLEKLSEGI